MSASSIVLQPGSAAERQGASMDSFLTPLQQQALNGYRRLQAEANRRGWQPASLINLHPFQWPVTGPVHQVDIRIPAVPLDKDVWLAAPKLTLRSGLEIPYTQYVFSQWKPLQQKYLMGQIDFEEINDSGHIWPIEQAEDAVKQNSLSGDRGGVFCYEGIHQPSAKESALIEDSHRAQMAYYRDWYDKANDAYRSMNSTTSWRDLVGKGKYHRWIAKYLFLIGSIKDLPTWYQEMSQVGGKAHKKCGACGHNLEPETVIHDPQRCGWVANPYRAFADLLIDADTPGAKLAAKRLSADEIDSLIEAGRLTEQNFTDWGFAAADAATPARTKKKSSSGGKAKPDTEPAKE